MNTDQPRGKSSFSRSESYSEGSPAAESADTHRTPQQASSRPRTSRRALSASEETGRNSAASRKASSRTSRRPAPRTRQAASGKTVRRAPERESAAFQNENNASHPPISRRLFIAGGVAVACAGVFGVSSWLGSRPISITVNDQAMELSGKHTVQAAFEASGVQTTPGNLIDVAGEVIEQGGGKPYTAALNDQQTDDPDAAVAEGDRIAFTAGVDVEEPSTTEEKTVEPSAVESGEGTIHEIETQGASGISSIKTGQTSGKEVVVEVIEPVEDRLYRRSYPDTGGEKVIALTFDDGPWEKSTAAILDVLRDNKAAATFFTVGNRISGAGIDLVKRAHDEGHQVCTHSWSHASGSGQGVNLSYMSAEEQRGEIEQGYKAISDATGAEASRIFRAPGGNFPLEVWRNVEDLVEAEIGWDIDTLDWKRPGTGKIVDQLKKATPGDIILMHDGGGNRSQTVDALRKALPYLAQQGFRFITVDEMMKYPRKDG